LEVNFGALDLKLLEVNLGALDLKLLEVNFGALDLKLLEVNFGALDFSLGVVFVNSPCGSRLDLAMTAFCTVARLLIKDFFWIAITLSVKRFLILQTFDRLSTFPICLLYKQGTGQT
jgi:hypothetical protein